MSLRARLLLAFAYVLLLAVVALLVPLVRSVVGEGPDELLRRAAAACPAAAIVLVDAATGREVT